MAKINTLYMTKMAEKPYPLGLHTDLYSPFRGVPPPPSLKFLSCDDKKQTLLIVEQPKWDSFAEGEYFSSYMK